MSFPGKSDDTRNHLRQLKNADLTAGAHIHMGLARIMRHQPHQRVGGVVDMQKFPSRRARTPDYQVDVS